MNNTTTKTIVSKSAKRKMNTLTNLKPNTFTQMVIYKTKLSNGKTKSVTKHEPLIK